MQDKVVQGCIKNSYSMFVLSIVLPAALSTGQTQNFIINRRLGAINILRNKKG